MKVTGEQAIEILDVLFREYAGGDGWIDFIADMDEKYYNEAEGTWVTWHDLLTALELTYVWMGNPGGITVTREEAIHIIHTILDFKVGSSWADAVQNISSRYYDEKNDDYPALHEVFEGLGISTIEFDIAMCIREYKDLTVREKWEWDVKNRSHMRKCDQCKTQYPVTEWQQMRWGIGSNIICGKTSCSEEMQSNFDDFCKESEKEDARRRDAGYE